MALKNVHFLFIQGSPNMLNTVSGFLKEQPSAGCCSYKKKTYLITYQTVC